MQQRHPGQGGASAGETQCSPPGCYAYCAAGRDREAVALSALSILARPLWPAERAAPELRRSQQAIWLARLEQDHNNLRVALAWSPTTSVSELAAAERGLRLGIAASELWI